MNNMPVGGGNKVNYEIGGFDQKTGRIYIVLGVAVIVALVFWWWWVSRQAIEAPQITSEAPAELEDVNQELEGLDIGDINEEFKQIDQELDTL